jgi:hypothetical protein
MKAAGLMEVRQQTLDAHSTSMDGGTLKERITLASPPTPLTTTDNQPAGEPGDALSDNEASHTTTQDNVIIIFNFALSTAITPAGILHGAPYIHQPPASTFQT